MFTASTRFSLSVVIAHGFSVQERVRVSGGHLVPLLTIERLANSEPVPHVTEQLDHALHIDTVQGPDGGATKDEIVDEY